MVKNTSKKSKSQVSGQGGGNWASLDKLKGNIHRDNNLNHAYVMLNSWKSRLQILESSLTAIWNHQLIVQWPPRKESTKCCESSGGILWKGQVLFCYFTSPWHVPILYAVLVSGRLQQFGKGNWYDKGNGASTLHKMRVQGFRLLSLGRRKLMRACCSTVYKNMDAVDKIKELLFAKCCRMRSSGNRQNQEKINLEEIK